MVKQGETKTSIKCSRAIHIAVLIAAMLLLLLVIDPANAADTDAFDEQTIQHDEQVLGVDACQFDGIASHELFVFLAGDSGRRVEILRQTIATTYDLNAVSAVDLPNDVFAYELLDLDDDGREEALLLGLSSCYLLDYDQGGFQPELQTLFDYEKLYSIPTPGLLGSQKLAFDLSGDGTYELVLPSWEGARIFRFLNGTYEHAATLVSGGGSINDHPGNMLSSYGAAGLLFSLPDVHVHDVNTDRIPDVLLAVHGDLMIWFQTGDLQFSSTPSQALELRQGFQRDLRFASASLADINNDQLVDFCRVITQGDRDEFRTIVEVFLGNISSGFSQRPSRRIVLEDFAVGLALTDLNDDGSHAIVVATVPVSATSMVKAFVVQRMSVELRVFEAVGGLVAEEPTSTKKISCGIDMFGTRMPTRYIGCMRGDLDGDNRADLAIVNDDDELQIFPGETDPHFSDKATAVRDAAGIRTMDAHDLNGDGKDDLILTGYDESGREVIHLLWSNQ